MPGSSLARLSGLVESLTGDLVFAMSRGSKELFHSDTLAWYVEHHPVLGEALMDAWRVPESGHRPGQVRVRREWRNLDLVVECPGRRPLVIENKVFSLPDTDQLASYADGKLHGLDHPILVLLSLLDPGWPRRSWTTPNGAAWHYQGYDELCAALRPCLPELRKADRFGADVFERWLRLIDTLVRLSTEVGMPADAEPLLLPAEAAALLKPARLDATVQKMRCLHATNRIRAELAGEIEQHGIIVRTAMSRGKGIVEMFTASPGPGFGWQIQEGQFRLVYLTGTGSGHGKGEQRRAAREHEARAFGDYFRFDQARDLLGDTGPERPVVAPEKPLSFNGFAPDFVYRSIPAPDLTIEQVVGLGARSPARL
ncbi:PD-(D/E)XK nuclease family protein [Streptomyces sp. CdTB01]|uniref:PD-(D/E)XK nuclease family protein n=1 Tax=Streptomyces sp. CdTB01 TaxID=1725411 RepID=UPI000A5632C6|nr:PD-(D/E)XK nuclease family protein [Streptomyces sp. CdTB01]